MLKTVAKDQEGGFDGKIRFPNTQEELCPGQTSQRIFKVDVGPILLAIKAGNPNALKDILENDKYVNLRESLAGPKELYSEGRPMKRWKYTYDSPGEIHLQFENLGFALLADCEQFAKPNHNLTMLVHLLKQPSFIPEQHDFESYVTICLLKKTSLMLKTFLQSFQIQFVFSNLAYEKQKRIVRLLLGLSPDGTECVSYPFADGNLTMKKPFLVFTLLEFLMNAKKIQGAESIAKELLTTLQSQDLQLIAYIDRDLVESVVTTEEWLDRLQASDPDKDEHPASEELVNYTTQIVNRIKSENSDMVDA